MLKAYWVSSVFSTVNIGPDSFGRCSELSSQLSGLAVHLGDQSTAHIVCECNVVLQLTQN